MLWKSFDVWDIEIINKSKIIKTKMINSIYPIKSRNEIISKK